ncbi:MAG TPA: protease HtpX, partial [Candidatus Goldiibacteriota bacterium]|nr:protease HtpX [Candidatus Goldiibacteriota bacterium]
MNYLKTGLLMTAMVALFMFIGNYFGGQQGMMIAFVASIGMNFFSYWFSDKMVLAAYRAQPVTPQQAPQLYAAVQRLTTIAQLPM